MQRIAHNYLLALLTSALLVAAGAVPRASFAGSLLQPALSDIVACDPVTGSGSVRTESVAALRDERTGRSRAAAGIRHVNVYDPAGCEPILPQA